MASRRRSPFFGLLALVGAVTLGAPGLAAAQLPVPPLAGSTFEGADGNQVVSTGGQRDWQSVASSAVISDDPGSDPADPASDVVFGTGSKETEPDKWSFATDADGANPPKNNVYAAWSTSNEEVGATFLNLALRREVSSGNTYVAIELNQDPRMWSNSVGASIPCRKTGDVVVTFQVASAGDPPNVTIVLETWTTSTADAASGCARTGSFAAFNPTAAQAQGAVNAVDITNYLDPVKYGATFLKGTFGEASLNLSSILGSAVSNPCFSFGSVWVHGRASISSSANLDDYVAPRTLIVRNCTVSGTKFKDLNADGVRQSASEPLVPGYKFFLDADDDGVLDAGETTTLTDATGNYAFTNLATGTYRIREAPDAQQAAAFQGWICTAPTPCVREATLTAANRDEPGQHFGNVPGATISGTKYEDLNSNGTRDGGEPGVEGVRIFLDTGNDAYDAGERETTTAADGTWSIGGLAPGTYAVREVLTGTWSCRAPASCEQSVTVASGATASGVLFGNVRPATVSGVKFEDADGDGTRDTGETLLSGWTIWADLDGDEIVDASEPQAVTNASGAYSLSVRPGEDTPIREVRQEPWVCSAPNPCAYTLDLTSNGTFATKDFGNVRPATVSGTKFEDTNGNGSKEASEDGFEDVTIYVDDDGTPGLSAGDTQTTSAANGTWQLTGLLPGSVTVRESVPADSRCTTANGCSETLTLVSSQNATGVLFGNFRDASISGTKWTDEDADGTRDPGDDGLGGVTIRLDRDDDGTIDDSTTTTEGGAWSFGDLGPGTYRITESVTGMTCSSPDPCSYLVTPTSGQPVLSRDFGNWAPVSISGDKVHDQNANGVRDAGEPVLSGVTIELDAGGDGTFETSTTTGVDGAWSFSGLRPGTYAVREIAGAGWQCTAVNGCTVRTTLTSGDADAGNRFLNTRPVTVSGLKFHDLDADGVRDEGEGPLAGVTMQLDRDRDGTVDATTTTAADGTFSFAGVLPGALRVRQVTPAGFECSAPVSCETDVTATSGVAVAGLEFGDFQRATLRGTKFEDADGDGTRDAGEALLAGVVVFLDADGDDALDADERQTTTDASGAWSFAALRPGGHVVREVAPAGTECSAPSSDPARCEFLRTLTSGEEVDGLAFGNLRRTAVAGTIYEDRDADGTREASDPPLPGIEVFLDLDQDGRQDADEPTTRTDAAGAWSFTGLLPGNYTVLQVISAPWACSAPSADAAECRFRPLLVAGVPTGGLAFGNFRPVEVSIDQVTTGGATTTFAFTSTLPGLASFGLADADAPRTSTAGPGTYTVTQTGAGDFDLSGLACTGATVTVDGARALIAVLSGEAVRCTWTNARKPQGAVESATVTAPPAAVPAKVPARVAGRARLRGPAGCTRKTFLAQVSGRSIASVVFKLDGKAVRTRARQAATTFSVRIHPSRLRIGAHRLVAVVRFTAESRTARRTLRLTFQRCANARRVAPRFTG